MEESLQRLNLKTLDIVYIHNPYEAQGPFNTDAVFYDRLQQAFETMEQLVSENKIRAYGVATYSSLRVKPTEQKMHLNIQRVEKLAQKVAGKSHNMKFVQVPVNVMMPEAFVEPWQVMEDSEGVARNKILVGCLSDMELNLVTSQPLL